MTNTSATLEHLIEQFAKLPGIGKKTAYRLAYHVLQAPVDSARSLADAIIAVKEKIRFCSVCFNVTDDDPCPICRSTDRDTSLVCVVEEPHDVLAFERAGTYRGVYHVLGGVFSPLDGIGPDELKIGELVKRVKDDGINEVIIATNPTAEGETTAVYLAKILRPLGVSVSRIARGLPMGGDVEYADANTVLRALEGRTEI
ncbi:MAG: recombination protein RecR [candidate division Zixibacteria bacterium]|nr:recombination protein RecR [candidate division Zixibacteria bacterium]